MMIRTQIRLAREDYTLLKREAQAAGISVAAWVSRAVRESLPARGDAPWMRYAGFIESGNGRSSRTIDDIVYGAKD
jgi:hypothetical protein